MRKAATPKPAKPISIMAQVDGSGVPGTEVPTTLTLSTPMYWSPLAPAKVINVLVPEAVKSKTSDSQLLVLVPSFVDVNVSEAAPALAVTPS